MFEDYDERTPIRQGPGMPAMQPKSRKKSIEKRQTEDKKEEEGKGAKNEEYDMSVEGPKKNKLTATKWVRLLNFYWLKLSTI